MAPHLYNFNDPNTRFKGSAVKESDLTDFSPWLIELKIKTPIYHTCTYYGFKFWDCILKMKVLVGFQKLSR